MPAKPLCRLQELPENGCREFVVDDQQIFVVRQDDEIFVYLNQCPHIGTPLNWKPDQFFDYEGKYLQCYSHGALFEVSTGLCVAGPCSGDFLVAVPFQCRDEILYLT